MANASADQRQEICALGVAELGRLYRSRQLSPVEVTRATLDRIERLNPELNAFITVMAESALQAARAAETQMGVGIDLGPLHGVPVSVKDIIRVKGTRTTAASRVLADSPPDEEDAPVVRRLRRAGAILVGKNNLYEFATGEPATDAAFGRVQNPRKTGHQTGGSSSGSGAAVAAGLSVVSLGTDTGGSIRIPAALCGVAGIKATYGLVPIRDVIPLSPYLDHVGPLGRSVADVAAGLAAIAGQDPVDPYSVPSPAVDYLAAIGGEVAGLRFGVPTNPFFQFGQPAVMSIVADARNTLAGLGLSPVPLDLYRADETTDLCSRLIRVDAWQYHRRHAGREELYGPDARQRTRDGLQTSGVEYAEARDAQIEIRRRWLRVFEQVDLLVMPCNVVATPRLGQPTVEVAGEEHSSRMISGRLTRSANLTGFPSLVVPVGATPEGLPVGLQLLGPPFSEARLFTVGHALEQALGNLPARWGIEPRG